MLIIHVLCIFSVKVRLSKFHILFSFVILFSILNSIFQNYEVLSVKAILNWFISFYVFLFALLLSKLLIKLNSEEIKCQLRNISFIFIGGAFFSIMIKFNFPVGNYANLHKPIFPFAEPSHFALTAAYILIPSGVIYQWKLRVLILLLTIILAFTLPSTVLLVVSLIMIYLFFVNAGITRALFVLFFGFLLSISFYLLKDFNPEALDYFTSRVVYDEETTNISLLVFLMGWQDAINALTETNGLGLGIFQMGVSFQTGEFGERIYDLVGSYKNLKDGGSLAAKSISELGVLGIILIVLYLRQLFLSSEFILKNRNSACSILLISHCWVVTFSIEIFIRATHYFSIGFILMLTALSIIGFFKGKSDSEKMCPS
ncbi:membrane hypothetical protein [Vibrio nigripulchritudo SO65]|nr:membrane hypothetical protein [Vibrio nigripulchritudo FTn2]CCN65070.1 membrane hypothetical protein [Vibrio nigripulchritudo POn4]CCN73994.1 membrane hypothetical protein [Vibrio nigripulchritudo SO65]